MVEVDASLPLTGPDGPLTLLDAFEGRQQLIAYYFMWHRGLWVPRMAPTGRTLVTGWYAELRYILIDARKLKKIQYRPT